MQRIGVIAEYNPFHNGHLYHLNKIKEMFEDYELVLILIGNFTQRGDVSVINKWDKTRIALDNGFDLVVELPFSIATSAADIYAYGAVKILNMLNCNYLVFGSETNDVNLFKIIADKTINNDDYESTIKEALKNGNNYPTACSSALEKITDNKICEPNDILGLEYVKAIKKLKCKIKPISIKRTNKYHDKKLNNKIASASAIRNNINNKRLIGKVMPKEVIKKLKTIDYNILFSLFKYQLITNNNLKDIVLVSEGIDNLFKKYINCNYMDDFILKVKTKRYSYNRIKRTILNIIMNLNINNQEKDITYIRVLGMDDTGKKIIKEVKDIVDVPIITKFKKEHEKLLKIDIRANNLYALITNDNPNNEYQSSIIKK